MQYITLTSGNLPISFACLQDGSVAVIPTSNFKGIVDYSSEHVAKYDIQGFSVDGVQYEYNRGINYKDEEGLISYLKSLNLDFPSQSGMFSFGF